ncbi:MAG: alpha/beta fold hydrolase [Pseudomonadota bacterium]
MTLDTETAELNRVFVTTSRQPTEAGFFGTTRGGSLHFTHFDISIPPVRNVGEITYPKRTPDPTHDFLTSEWSDYPDPVVWRNAINERLSQLPPDQREVAIYVHGFNNTFAEGLYRAAQISEDYQIPGIMAHYSWPSAGNPLTYAYDRDSVLYSRDGLEAMLRELSNVAADRIIIVAHSMGSLLTMETLRQIDRRDPGWARRNLHGVVLMSPDIDPAIFKAQARDIAELPDQFIILTSDKDRALQLSARLTGQTERLGNVGNVDELAEFNITVVNISEFSTGGGHMTGLTSPALIGILSQARELDASIQGGNSGRVGILPGTVLTVQNATEVILSPGSGSGGGGGR